MAAATASSSAAAAADPSPNSPSPHGARAAAARHPWSHVVRGGEPEGSALPPPSSPPLIPSPDPSDRSPRKSPPEDAAASSSGAARGKKPAWQRPSNGLIEAGHVVIGGAASWPALSESSVKAVSKLPSSSSDEAPLAASPAPGPAISISNSSSTPNHVALAAPERQKSMKRGGGSNIGVPPTSAPMPQNMDKQMPRELSTREQIKNSANSDHGSRGGGSGGSQVHDGGDHHRRYSGNRRWNNGVGSGSHQNNYSNRRDQERGGFDGFRRNARDIHMQHRGSRPLFRPPPPPVAPPYLGHIPQVQPFGNPMLFPDMQSPVFYVATPPPPGSVPFVPHPAMPPAMYIQTIDVQRANLLKQIEFYFSEENLCRDVFLRRNMDEQGWVAISLIAGFNRVKSITNNIEFILDTMQLSNEVEVQGDRIRKRNDWAIWRLGPSTNQLSNISSQSSTTLNSDNLAARLRTVALERTSNQSSIGVPNRSGVIVSRSVSGNPSITVVNPSSDGNRQISD